VKCKRPSKDVFDWSSSGVDWKYSTGKKGGPNQIKGER